MDKLKVLVVEDTAYWQDIYKRNIEKTGCDVKVSGNRTETFEILDQESFDLAIVDIRLDEADDQNVDGLRVLEQISKLGESTNSIVVTGHGDIRIARDALQRYNAVCILEKNEISPAVIRDLINQQIASQKQKFRPSQQECSKLLSGVTSNDAAEILVWESRMQNILKPSGGVDQMYEIFQLFVEKIAPLIFVRGASGMQQDDKLNTATGYAWSKRLAQAIGIFIGNEKEMTKIFENKVDYGDLNFESYPCSKMLLRVDVGNLSAVALSLPNIPFSRFK